MRIFQVAVLMAWSIAFAGASQDVSAPLDPVPSTPAQDIVLRTIPDGPVARAGSETIGPDEFQDLYITELVRVRRMSANGELNDVDRLELAMRCLRLLVERSILYQSAKERGLAVSDAALQEAWSSLMDRMGENLAREGGEPLSEAKVLEIAGTSEKEAREELRRTLTIEKMRDRIMQEEGVHVTDTEIAEFFQANEELARVPDRAHVQQVLIHINGRGPEEARQRADRALGRLRSGESFQAVAKDMSDGLFADSGGDPGQPIPLQIMPEEIRAVVSKMGEGEISDVLQSELGYHIIRMIEFIPGSEPSLEDATPTIRRLLETQKGNQVVRQFVANETQDKKNIHIYLNFDRELQRHPELVRYFENVMSGEAPTEPGTM